MAHPKLSTLINRSVLTVGTAALLAGPFAATASAQIEVDIAEEIDCEALRELPIDQLPDGVLPEECVLEEEPVAKATEEGKKGAKEAEEKATEVKETVEETVAETVSDDPTEEPSEKPSGSGEGSVSLPGGTGGSGGSTSGGSGSGPSTPLGNSGNDTGSAGSNVQEIDDSGSTRPAGPAEERRYNSESSGSSFNSSQQWGGYSTTSSLTLQPFESPIVSVPPVYDIPQVAAALLGRAAAPASAPVGTDVASATSGAPMMTALSANSTGVPTAADIPAWLLATSTGLLVLVGAAHFVNATNKAFESR